jgi:hypothetical protein
MKYADFESYLWEQIDGGVVFTRLSQLGQYCYLALGSYYFLVYLTGYFMPPATVRADKATLSVQTSPFENLLPDPRLFLI